MKWIALVSMTIDHINRFFYASSIQTLYCIGRLAMPLFAFIFAYNLARPDALPADFIPKF
ncbi:TraX family protein [Legionella micdadei]|uniref:TraX family protein n=1 Tax=Legionella micdadei TaxID=451 RepID=UPI00155F84B7|nr:TraX family protein [Legionella micdadei]